MNPIVTAKESGKSIAIAILTVSSRLMSGLFRRKQEAMQLEKMGRVVSSLEDCLRKVEIELLRINDLSPSRIKELKEEKNKLLTEIDAVTRAAGLTSPALLDLLDKLEHETEVSYEIFYAKRPQLVFYLIFILAFSFFGYAYFSLIID